MATYLNLVSFTEGLCILQEPKYKLPIYIYISIAHYVPVSLLTFYIIIKTVFLSNPNLTNDKSEVQEVCITYPKLQGMILDPCHPS